MAAEISICVQVAQDSSFQDFMSNPVPFPSQGKANVSDVIRKEVILQFGPNGPYPERYDRIALLLNPPKAPGPNEPPLTGLNWVYQMEHWCRWCRMDGIPTTSNAAESVHAKLNALKNPDQLLVGRIRTVMQYCLDRYAQRNLKSRKQARASTRFFRLLHNDTRKLFAGTQNAAKLKYYTQLNTLKLQPEEDADHAPITLDWNFPEVNLKTVISREAGFVHIRKHDDVNLPPGWEDTKFAQSDEIRPIR